MARRMGAQLPLLCPEGKAAKRPLQRTLDAVRFNEFDLPGVDTALAREQRAAAEYERSSTSARVGQLLAAAGIHPSAETVSLDSSDSDTDA